MGKSSRHQNQNTFKFKKFSDRISNLKIDVIHQIKRPEDNDEDTETYFGSALFKWCSLNLTNDFNNFKNEISDQVKTFVQLVHHSDEIVAALLKHLAVPQSMAYDALLDLVVQLARDLQCDFYKHFPDVFNVLVALLKANPQDVQLLEMVFTCLSYLFKFLWRYMVKDIKSVFSYFLPLLSTSNKSYIREFAAESFGFLIRKVKDQEEIFDFIFQSLNKRQQHTAGISRLIFEVMKNVQNHVHSCAVKVFPVILSKLGPDPTSDNIPDPLILNQIEICVTQIMEALGDHVDGTDHISHLWPILLEAITKQNQLWLKGENSACENLRRLLNVTSVWLKFKHGVLVSEPDKVSNVLSAILKSENVLPESTLSTVLNCVSLLVHGCFERLSMSSLSRLINLSFNKRINADIVYPFAKTLFSMPLFEKNVLYPLMEFMQNTMKEKETISAKEKTLLMATELILFKISPVMDASELEDYGLYPMDFSIIIKRASTKVITFSNYIQSLISDTDLDNRRQLMLTWAAIVCMPHIRPQSNSDVLKKLIHKLLIHVKSSDEKQPLKNLHLFILSQAVQGLYLMEEESQFFECITLDEVELLLKSFSNNVHALQIADIFFWVASYSTDIEDVCNSDTCLRIYSFLESNLSNPSHQVRLLTVQILSRFQLPFPITDNPDIIPIGVFNICLNAERIPRTVQDYREIIKYLQKLDSCLIKNSIPQVDPRFNQVPLRFLLGNLFCNFKPLWEPVRKLITSHATSMPKDDFWEVFGEHLKQAASNCENNTRSLSICDAYDMMPAEEDSELDTALLQICTEQIDNSVKRGISSANEEHFREQLWKTMLNFPQICEANSSLLSNLLFQFIENEFNQVNKDSMARQNILNREWKEKIEETEEESMEDNVEEEMEEVDEEKTEETDVNMEVEEEDENEADVTAKQISVAVHKQQKDLNNLLVSHLQLFSQFRHGNSLSCSKKLKELFEMLLEHKEPMIQKIAFECLMIFPIKGIGLYRENFMRILEEKTFRDELALFNADSECCIVEEYHRTTVMSILTRILYGTLQNKKITVSKKGQVFSFLCGCKLEEQLVFIDLVLKPCEEFLADVTIPELMASVDLRNMLPPKVMQSFLNLILLIMRKLGHYITVYLPKLLKVILGIAATGKVCLGNKHKIYHKALVQMKTVYKMSLTRLFQFFDIFKAYPYSPSEMDSLFDVVVWPKIQSLPVESLKTPTYLLNFLHAWTKSPRFFPCLLKRKAEGTEISAMPYIFQLLSSKGISKSVLHVVMEMIYNLISVGIAEEEEDQLVEVKMEEEELEEEGNEEKKDLSKEILVLNGCPSYSRDKQELGIQILKPHIPILLEYLQKNISSVISRLNRKNASCRELTILSKITTLVTSSKQCSMMVSLLLSILAKKGKRSWETELDLLTSILNMMQVIKKDILNLYKKVTCLFASIKHRRPRKVLCDIVQKLSEKQPKLEEISKILYQLNSWNPNRIEEPNFHERLAGFKAANKMVSDMKELDVNFLIPLVHNCCFFIVSVDDFSIRDNSTNCLITIINQFNPETNRDKFAYQEIIERTILPEIRAGIGGVNQIVRAEFCTVLRALIIKFSSRKPFDGLVKITDNDPDLDFFENIKHIQVHRRTRALRRLANNLASYEMEREALLFYLLPLANGYLQTKFKKIEGLQEAAIELLGALCSQLPWKIYQKELRYYLNKITTEQENHKLMMKIVISILDGFHFDLSKSTCTGPSSNILLKHVLEKEENKEKRNKDKEEKEEEEEKQVEDDEDNEDENDDKVNKQSSSGLVICPTGMANRIHTSIVKNILPKLYKCLVQKVRSETEHKLVKSKYAEDFEILRVPIALAMVKLLKNLPEQSMKSTLPSILLRVCQFLKSRSQDIRKSSRETLVKIVQSLGPSYFPYILSEMKTALTRGYQLHVLGFTTHSLLQALSGQLKVGDLDSSLKNLIEVFNEDIFGEVAEEKTVEALTSKLMEAKNCKSFNSYQVLAKYMSTNYMTALIGPLKQILDDTNSHKVSQKVELVLKRLMVGFSANKSLEVKDLMIFIYSLVCQTLPLLVEKKMESEKLVHPLENKQESCLILPKAPTREGKKSKISKKTNVHILVEFGLKLLFYIFKQSRLKSSELDHLQLLDPFVNILIDCLDSKHIKVIICAIKSLCIMLKFPLPSIKKHVKRLADSLFILLNTYAASGAARGENAELVFILFRIVTILVREINYYKIKPEQLQVLVMYCEEDICDYTRQSSAFTLIKAIMHRKLDSPEVTEMMNLMKNMAITSEAAHVRKQCREVILRYLLDYSIGQKSQNYVDFFVKHLSFSVEEGRLSAIEILTAIIRTFPPQHVADHSVFFFLPLSANLINDKSATCRKNIASAIKMLLEKLDSKIRKDLFTFVIKWYEDKKMHLRTVAAQLLGLFVDVEKEQFSERLTIVLPLLNKSLMQENIQEAQKLAFEKSQDHFLYNNLNTLLKILRCCDVAKNPKWTEQMNMLWKNIQNCLNYPHTWVQLMSGQLFGLLFMSYPPDQLVADIFNNKVQKSNRPVPFLIKDGQKKIHSLVMDSVAQLQSPLLQKAQAEQAVKNLVYLTKVIKRLNIQQGIIDPSLVPEISNEEREKLVKEKIKDIENESKMEEEEEEEPELEEKEPELEKKEESPDLEESKIEEEEELGDEDLEEEEEDLEEILKNYSSDKEEKDELEEENIEEEKVVVEESMEEESEEEEEKSMEEDMEDEEAEVGTKEPNNEDKGSDVTLPWIVRKMTREAHYENIHNPKITLKRSFVFKWFAAVAVDLGANLLASVLHIMLPALHRELNDTVRTQDTTLKNLTQEVMELLKNTVGVEIFSYKYAIVHRDRKERSESRKRQKAIQVVTNPEIAYKRKIKRNLIKKQAKKRKIELLRPEKALKKRKTAK